jgi:hypothetical protein
MGLDRNGTKLLLYAKSLGVDFGKTIMLGRQGLHVDKKHLQNNLSQFGITNVSAEDILKEEGRYAEPFLRLLGAKEIYSIDASDYESATVIHDMNLPIADKYKKNYGVVIDGGSLEHIFNFPVAIKNCMEMVKIGGYFLGITPANNFFGHGFYQFSPDLYFKVFSPENGFKMEKLIFFIDKKNPKWYEVKDPDEVKTRVTLCNNYPSYLFVIGKRISDTPIFETTPQQGFYQKLLWKDEGRKSEVKPTSSKTSIITKVLNLIADKLELFFIRLSVAFKETGYSDKNFFKRIKNS